MSRERLTILSGPLKDREFSLDKSITIGRSPENVIFLDDRQVSRKHATVELTQGGTVLKDLSSGNGTFVNDRRVLEYRLTDGDVFKIGSVEMRYEGRSTAMPDSKEESTSGSRVRFQEKMEGKVESSSTQDVHRTLFGAPEDTVDSEELKTAQSRLSAIYKANQIISSEQDLKRLFARVMEQIFTLVPANSGLILLKDEKTQDLVTAYERVGSNQGEINVSSTIVKQAFDDGENVLVRDASEDVGATESIVTGNIASALCVPLVHQDERLGVIYVDTRGTTNAFTPNDRDLLVALAGPAATAIKNVQYVEQLESDFQTTLRLLANAIELRDHYTAGHTWRVTHFSIAIATELGWNEERIRLMEMGGALHDVGKIAVPDAVLQKPGRLTEDEYAQIQVHPERGAALLSESKKTQALIPHCLYHHEKYDGTGYPRGLKGEDIPIEGRIVAVADTFDAMTSNRPYRKGLDVKIAIAEIEKCKGTQFDPICADAFIRAYQEGTIDHILQDYHQGDGRSVVCPFCSTYIALGDNDDVDSLLACGICRRSVRVTRVDDAWVGQLLSQAELAEATEGNGNKGT